MIGHVSNVLGHADPSSASAYQGIDVENVKVWTVDAPAAEMDEDGWQINGAAERKRFQGINELIAHRLKITSSSLRAWGKGSMPVVDRIIRTTKRR